MGGQRIRLKPDSVPTKFIFSVEKPKRKKPVDRASLNAKKTLKKKSQQHSVSGPINIENTDLKSGSDGIETEHLEGEDLVQTGDENWKHQLKLKDDEKSCLLEKWQTTERELNKKIQTWKINLKKKEPGRRELELVMEKKACKDSQQKQSSIACQAITAKDSRQKPQGFAAKAIVSCS